MQPATRNAGSGKIVTSALVVTGFDTKFSAEFKAGDALEIVSVIRLDRNEGSHAGYSL